MLFENAFLHDGHIDVRSSSFRLAVWPSSVVGVDSIDADGLFVDDVSKTKMTGISCFLLYHALMAKAFRQ